MEAYIGIPVQIEKVLELEGLSMIRYNSSFQTTAFAHVGKPVKKGDEMVQYVMLALGPRHGHMKLGYINESTRVFEEQNSVIASYQRSSNNVIGEVVVPAPHLRDLKTLDEILAIPGIKIKRELRPANDSEQVI